MPFVIDIDPQWMGYAIAVLATVLIMVARRRARPNQRRSIELEVSRP